MSTNPINNHAFTSQSLGLGDLKYSKLGNSQPESLSNTASTSGNNTELDEMLELISSNNLMEKKTLLKAETVINEALFSRLNREMSFSVDENTKRLVITIVNKETGEEIKQIPPQEFLDMVYNLNKVASMILNNELPKYI